jgi:predicted double-glycine peptidase
MKKGLSLLLILVFFTRHTYAGDFCAASLSRPFPHTFQKSKITCGPACFNSTLKYLGISSPGEAYLANAMGTFYYGTTYPNMILITAHKFGLYSEKRENQTIANLAEFLKHEEIVFLRWRSRGVGHYSVLTKIENGFLYLMDPWFKAPQIEKPIKLFSLDWQSSPDFEGEVIRINNRSLIN